MQVPKVISASATDPQRPGRKGQHSVTAAETNPIISQSYKWYNFLVLCLGGHAIYNTFSILIIYFIFPLELLPYTGPKKRSHLCFMNKIYNNKLPFLLIVVFNFGLFLIRFFSVRDVLLTKIHVFSWFWINKLTVKEKEYVTFFPLYLWDKNEPIWLEFTVQKMVFSADYSRQLLWRK